MTGKTIFNLVSSIDDDTLVSAVSSVTGENEKDTENALSSLLSSVRGIRGSSSGRFFFVFGKQAYGTGENGRESFVLYDEKTGGEASPSDVSFEDACLAPMKCANPNGCTGEELLGAVADIILWLLLSRHFMKKTMRGENKNERG